MRRLRPTGITSITIFVLLAMTAAGTAIAYFTTSGTGESEAKTITTLATPTIASATPGAGGTVTLNWNAVSPPGTGGVSYKVERDDGSAAGTCVSALTVTSCVDTGLEPGTYEYVVTAKWRSWTTSSSGKKASVTIGPIDHFTLSATTLSPIAGAADNLTITAKDDDGGTVTSYEGSHDLTFSGPGASPNGAEPTVSDSGGTPVAFGEATSIDFDDGVATVSTGKNGAMKLYKGGSTSIGVGDSSVSTDTPLALTVSPATASKFALAAESATPTAGVADNLTITARDAYGNTATSYTGSKSLTFSGASASPGGTQPTVANSSGTATNFGTATSISFSAGIATVSTTKNGVMKIYKSGEADIEVKEGSTVTTETPLEVTVTPATASKFVLGASTTTPAAGAVDNLTVTAQDAYGNTATSYAGSKSLVFSGASASPDGTVPTISDSSGIDVAFGESTPTVFSAGVATVDGTKNGAMKLYKGGSTSLKATDGTLLTPTALVVTVGTTATRLLLAAASTTPAAGASDNLTITAQDAYENTATSYAGSKSLTFSGAATIGTNKPTVANSSGTATAFGSATAITFTSGVATVTSSKNGLMKVYAAGEAAIAVTDGSISTETALSVTVSPGAASKFVLTAATTTPAAGEANNLTTTAQDTYGNVATSYTGTKSITFSTASASPNGTVPTVSDSSGADVAFATATTIEFTAGFATPSGTKNGVAKLYKSGSTSLKATDGTLLTPTALVVTVAAGGAVKFALSSSATSLTTGGSANLTTTAQDTYGNTATSYTGAKNLTFSGASASPNGTSPTVANSSGTATNFGAATAITFTSGVASVSSSKNGLMKLYKPQTASVAVTDGTISSAAPVAVTVATGAATRWGLNNIKVSAGSLSANCVFTCTLTGLGNSGTVTAKVTVVDAYGNIVSALGTGHAAKVTTNGSGTISGSPLAIPATGLAESATSFTFTSKSSGTFTETVTIAFSEGTAYTAATVVTSK